MAGEPQRRYITFTTDAEEYGVDVMAIREIKGWTEETVLPEMPRHVRGVIDLRGTIVPIFDLRARFGGDLTESTPRHVVVVLAVFDRLVGLLVDAVVDIVDVCDGDIQAVPDVGHVAADFVDGIVTRTGRMVALLDAGKLLDARHIRAAHEAGAAGSICSRED